jgi:hypothetical protein
MSISKPQTEPLDGPAPEVTQSTLDDVTVLALFDDIAELCEVLAIIIKGHAVARASSTAVNLNEARALFLSKSIQGLQIRYRHDDAEWWDTLMHTPEGMRIVRVRHVWE